MYDTKYHQNVSKGIRVIERSNFPRQSSFKGYYSKGQQGEQLSLHVTHCLDPISIRVIECKLSTPKFIQGR